MLLRGLIRGLQNGLRRGLGFLFGSEIVPRKLVDGADSTDQNAYPLGTVAPGAGRLMLLWIMQSGTAANGPSSFTGTFGGALTLVDSAASATRRISLYRYLSSAPSSGTIIANFAGGDVTTGIIWCVMEYAGVDQSGSNGAGAIVQAVAANNSAGTTAAVALAALSSPHNLHAYGIMHQAQEDIISPGAGFTKRSDNSMGSPAIGMAVADGLNDNSPDPTWASSVISRHVAVELKRAAG